MAQAWTPLPDMPKERHYHAMAVTPDGKNLVYAGGQDASFTNLKSVVMYNFRKKRWTSPPDMPVTTTTPTTTTSFTTTATTTPTTALKCTADVTLQAALEHDACVALFAAIEDGGATNIEAATLGTPTVECVCYEAVGKHHPLLATNCHIAGIEFLPGGASPSPDLSIGSRHDICLETARKAAEAAAAVEVAPRYAVAGEAFVDLLNRQNGLATASTGSALQGSHADANSEDAAATTGGGSESEGGLVLISMRTLPAGLTLTSTAAATAGGTNTLPMGIVYGSVAEVGIYTLEFGVSTANGIDTVYRYNLYVKAEGRSAIAGIGYSHDIRAGVNANLYDGIKVQAVSPLPPGLAFDSLTGVLSGTPTNAGTFRVEIGTIISADVASGAAAAAATAAATLVADYVLVIEGFMPVLPVQVPQMLAVNITRGVSSTEWFSLTNVVAEVASNFDFRAIVEATVFVGLPNGLETDTATGIIKGSTTDSGVHTVHAQVWGRFGVNGVQHFTLELSVQDCSDMLCQQTSCLDEVLFDGVFQCACVGDDCTTNANADGSSDEASAGMSIGGIAGLVVAIMALILVGIGVVIVCNRHVNAEAERKFSSQMVVSNSTFKSAGPDTGAGMSFNIAGGPATLLELQRSDITVGSTVRAGAFGQLMDGRIYFRENQITKTRRVLIKQLELPASLQLIPAIRAMSDNLQDLSERDLLKDAGSFFDFDHPNVAKVIGVVTVGDPCLVLFEYFGHGSLHDYLKKNMPKAGIDPIPTRQRLQMCIDMTEGLAYLHSRLYLHRDLCARNVLVAERLTLKLGDFSLNPKAGTACARLLQTAEHRDGVYPSDLFMSGRQGANLDLATAEPSLWPPTRWLASECFSGSNFSNASDVWALAVTFYEVYTNGELPFASKSQDAIEVLVNAGMRMNKPDAMPNPVYVAALDCWALNPTKRPPLGALSMIFNRMKWEGHEDVVEHWNRVVKGANTSSTATSPPTSPGRRSSTIGNAKRSASKDSKTRDVVEQSESGGWRAPTALRLSVGRNDSASNQGGYMDPASREPVQSPDGKGGAGAPSSVDLTDWWAGVSRASKDEGVGSGPESPGAMGHRSIGGGGGIDGHRRSHRGLEGVHRVSPTSRNGSGGSGGDGGGGGSGGGGAVWRSSFDNVSPRKLSIRRQSGASIRALGDGAVVMDPSVRVPTPPQMHFYPASGIQPATKAIEKKEISVPRPGSFVHLQHVNMEDGSSRERDPSDVQATKLEEAAKLQRSFGSGGGGGGGGGGGTGNDIGTHDPDGATMMLAHDGAIVGRG